MLTFTVGGESMASSVDCRDDDCDVSCKVDFKVEIRVLDVLILFVLDGVLGKVTRRQVDAFERLVNKVYFR